MKKRIQSLWFVSAAALLLSAGALNAQTSSQTQAPDAQAQQPAQPPTSDQPAPPPQAAPSQTPDQTQPAQDSQMQSAQPTGTQSFSGTIVKSGDKYKLQDEASGKSYDIDHQNEVQKFDGKRVKVKGTLDATGTIIQLQ